MGLVIKDQTEYEYRIYVKRQEYIDQAVSLALRNVKDGGKPFGSIVVKEGKVVAPGKIKLNRLGI